MAAAGTDHWITSDCIAAALAKCCGINCDDIPTAVQTFVTIQNVSGCPCEDGVTLVASDTPPSIPGDPYDWLAQSGSFATECDCPDGTTFIFTDFHLQCSDGVLILDFGVECKTAFDGTVLAQMEIHASTSPGVGQVLLTVVSYTPDPFELVIEADTDPTSDFCYPGRLRFTLTRM